MPELYLPEGFYVTTLSADINASTSTIPLGVVPSRVTKGYLIIEPTHATKREVAHFTSVGGSSVTTADDTTDASDATGRGCLGSITVGANTTHLQGVTVIIAASEAYWSRLYDFLNADHDITDGSHTLTQLKDTNGNETIKTPATSNAVNELTVANSATGNPVVVSATGGDTDIHLDLKGKGAKTVRKPTSISIQVFGGTTDVSTGDGKFYFTAPPEVNGMVISAVHARVVTAGTTGTSDIQIHNVTDAVDVLSTKLTIDTGETGSDTAATPAVINTSNDDVATNDLFRIDVDAVSTTPPKGLVVRITFGF